MTSKLAGHGLQLLGHALVFLGLGVAAGALFVATSYPTVPLWAFVSGGTALGGPIMIVGGRINGRGRGIVIGMAPGDAAREYRVQTIVLALYLGFLWLHGAVVAAPLFVCWTGLVRPHDPFVLAWIVTSMLALCAGRDRISRPVWRAIERRAISRWGAPKALPSGHRGRRYACFGAAPSAGRPSQRRVSGPMVSPCTRIENTTTT